MLEVGSGVRWAVFLVQFPHMASSQVVVMTEELGHVSLVFQAIIPQLVHMVAENGNQRKGGRK